MGKIRQRSVMQTCPTCEAGINSPCVHRITRKEIKVMHRARTWAPAKNLMNEEIEREEMRKYGDGAEELEYWLWVWRWFGLDPDDQYHGEDGPVPVNSNLTHCPLLRA